MPPVPVRLASAFAAAWLLLSIVDPISAQISFDPPTSYAVQLAPTSVTAGYFDDDPFLDLAVTNSNSNTVSVLLNNGDGTFAPQLTYDTGSGPFALDRADFDADLDIDLAIVNQNSDNVLILLNDGSGHFESGGFVPVGSEPRSVVAVDVNHDDNIDLAVVNRLSNTVSVLLNDGSGSLSSATQFAVGDGPRQVVSGLFNADAHPDLAVTNHDGGSITVLAGDGTGQFAPVDGAFAGGLESPDAIAAGDLDGDLDPDLIVGSGGNLGGTISLLINNGSANFELLDSLPAGNDPAAIKLAQLTEDDWLDVVVSNQDLGSIYAYQNLGSGQFSSPATFDVAPNPYYIVTGDFAGSGLEDIAVPHAKGTQVSVLINLTALCVGDVVGDGSVDVSDLLTLIGAWGQDSGPADINGDGIVNVDDLLQLIAAWGPCD